jgi:hypothetical protein
VPPSLSPANHNWSASISSTQLIILCVLVTRVTRHTSLRWHGVLVRLLLLLLEVRLVVQGSFGGHVGGRHSTGVARHATGLLGRDLCVALLGRVDWAVSIDTVRRIASGLGSVQTGLRCVSSRNTVLSDCEVAYLDEVLALGLCDEWLQLWGCEGVDETGLRDNEEQYLSTSENGQFIGLEIKHCVSEERSLGTMFLMRGGYFARDVVGWIKTGMYCCDAMRANTTYLLHDTGLSLGEGDVPS